MQKISFNNDWILCKDGKEQKITLPYDAMIREKRSADSENKAAGGYFSGAKYVYKKKFSVSQRESTILEFEGVYGICLVTLNGQEIAKNSYGYNNFFVDVSNYLKEGENLLEVEADNSQMINSRWYSGSGIYRSVWLYQGKATHLRPDGIKISVPDIEKKLAKAFITVDFSCETENKKIVIETIITDDKGNEVCRQETPFTVFNKGDYTAQITAYIKNPKLWSENRPILYNCSVNIMNEKEVIDGDEVKFGIRKVQVDPINGLRINGRITLLRGACIHQDNGIIGADEYYDAAYRRIKYLKKAGFNAIRIAHQPCSKPMLEACDKLGMLVLEETFDMWEEAKNKQDFSLHFADEWKKVIINTVNKDFNHPSVIMYSIGNEIPEIVKPNGIRISRDISNYLRSLDDTRPITNAINGLCAATGNTLSILVDLGLVTKEQIKTITGNPDSDNSEVFGTLIAAAQAGTVNDAMTALAGNLGRVVEHKSVGQKLEETVSHLDVCGYNYMRARYDVDAKEYPERVLLGTETFPPEIDLLWEKCKGIPQLIGDFTWTGWDYIGEAGVGHTNYEGKSQFAAEYPGYLAYCGDIDITGYRLPISYLREIVFGLRDKPYVSVQHPKYFDKKAKTTSWAEVETLESWTFAGYEGKKVKVKVYANADEVALFINGKQVERKKPVRMRAEFEVTYQVGEITAVAYREEKEFSHTIKTAEKPSLKISLDKENMKVGEICYAEFETRDENGTLNMDVPKEITLDCSDSAELIGFGTADPCATDNFFDNTHTAFNGRAVAVIRGKSKGIAKLQVSCDGKVNEIKLRII